MLNFLEIQFLGDTNQLLPQMFHFRNPFFLLPNGTFSIVDFSGFRGPKTTVGRHVTKIWAFWAQGKPKDRPLESLQGRLKLGGWWVE